ncbi:MAG: PQQ-binding-like beta-propeller repeat protein [Sedimentisphaerales bacterium]|nr:PQQ-binding-like beta-propeller repeat protein [Sedimentisphaerales bacterium]
MYRYTSLFVLIFIILVNPGTTKAEDWPSFMHDNQRSGVTSEQFQLPLSECWVFNAAHEPQPAWPPPAEQDFWHRRYNLRATVTYDRAFHIVTTGDMLFFGSSADDKVYALDAQTGEELWTYFTEAPIRLAPTVSGNKVYVGSDDGFVYCLSRNNGSLIWKYKVTDNNRMIAGNERIISAWPVRTGILIDKGNLYSSAGLFPNQQAFLFSLDAEDGTVKWKQKVDVSPQGYMLASDEQLYVPTGRTNPAIFTREDGSLAGRLPSGGGTFALLAKDVLVTGPGLRSKELNASDVNTQYKIATFNGLCMLVKDSIAYMLSEKKLSAFNRDHYLDLSRQRNKLSDQADKLKDRLKKTDKKTDEAKELNKNIRTLVNQISELSRKMKDCYLWTIDCKYPHSMIMAGDVLFLGGDNEIAAFNVEDGSVIWKAPVSGKAYGLCAANGALYASTDKGKIHCFRNNPKTSVKTITAQIQKNPYPDDSLTKQYSRAAKLTVEQTGISKGYCLILDNDRGRLAYELARTTDLKIIGIEKDAGKAAAARNAIDKGGLYGRVAVHQTDPVKLPYTKYIANLITSDKALRTGELPPSSETIFEKLRPYGGTLALVLPAKTFDRQKLQIWGQPFIVEWNIKEAGDIVLAWAKRKGLEGAGEWTHMYAEPGNVTCSGDEIVKGDMAVQWFGQPGPKYMIDRHHRNIPPLVKDGRLFAPGDNVVYGIDAYNGTIEWMIEVPNSRRLGAFLDCGSMVVDEKLLYLATEDKCLGFDVQTGQYRITYKMPQLITSEQRYWGLVAYTGNILFGSGRKKDATYTETSYEADDSLWYRNMKVVTSDYLFAMDKEKRRVLWKYKDGLIPNTTIAIGDGRMYFIETNSPKAMSDTLGRMPIKILFDGGEQYLVALDTKTGQILLRKKIDVGHFEEPVYINYAKDILLLSGSRLEGRTIHYYYDAYDSRSGKLLWQTAHPTKLPIDGSHGEYNRHPTIIKEIIYAWPYKYNLKTGEKIEGWEFDRHGHGCGGISASAQCLFWRGNNPWMYDLGPNGGPRAINKVSRPGCWINIIPACGLVLIPESSSGCTCGYSLQTSMAFVPK